MQLMPYAVIFQISRYLRVQKSRMFKVNKLRQNCAFGCFHTLFARSLRFKLHQTTDVDERLILHQPDEVCFLRILYDPEEKP